MLGGKALPYRLVIGVVMGGVIAFPLGAFAAKTFLTRKQILNTNSSSSFNSPTGPFLIEGFDFNLLRRSDNEWRGPNIGEKVDLTRLKARDGKTLASIVVDKRPIVLVSVKPDCEMSRIARDEMIHLGKKLASMDINYYLVFFASQSPEADFFKYSNTLNVGAQSFLWNSEAGPPPESIFTMTSPSHLLLNSDGTVIRVWPGSYEDVAVRQRMARQILADTSVVLDTLNAVMPPHVGTR